MDNNAQKICEKRNYGIDLLRLFSMLMIVVLHIYGKGGLLENLYTADRNAVSKFLYIMAYSAVNCYALVSGFVSYSDSEKTYTYKSWFVLWIQAIFYGVLICVLLKASGFTSVSGKDFLKAILPISFDQYWYLTAYTGVFFLRPYLDKAVRSLDKKQAIGMGVFVLIVTLYYTFLGGFTGKILDLNYGYSFVWLAILYLLGATIQKYKLHLVPVKIKNICLICLGFIGITWIFDIAEKEVECIRGIFQYVNLCSYVSPTVLGCAICMLIIFSKINCGIRLKKVIKYFAPAVFGVYLIHVQPLFYNQILDKRFVKIGELPAFIIPVVVVVTAVVIMVICMLIDRVRIRLFEILRINILATMIDCKVRNLMHKSIRYLALQENRFNNKDIS